MFERYTEASRRAIFFARYEAAQEGSSYIETEHLLLGVFHDPDSRIDEIFHLHTRLEEIRQKVRSARLARAALANDVDLPLSNENKRVLAYAAEEAEYLGSDWVDSEHLLLGLLREKKTFAAKLLKELGIDLETARVEVRSAPSPNYPLFSGRPAAEAEQLRKIQSKARLARYFLIA